MRKWKGRFGLLIVGGVIASYVNCAGPGFEALQGPGAALTGGATSGSLENGSQVVMPDSQGRATAYQDRAFRMGIPGAVTGANFSAMGLPAWMSLDPLTGEISGVPADAGVHSNILVRMVTSGAQLTIGPFQVTVIADPLKTQQWHLGNTGQKSFAGLAGKAGEDIHLSGTIRSGVLGEGVRVAVSDTGVQESHRGLQPNLLSGASRNYLLPYSSTQWIGSSSPSTGDGDDAHGTAVAGLIAERGWSGVGGRGVAPLAKFAGFLYIQAQSALSSANLATAGWLDQFAGDFDVFNYSWGDSQCALIEYGSSYAAKLKAGVTNLRGGKGAIYVKAAGNEYYGYLSDCYDGVSSSAFYLGNANFSEESAYPYTILAAATNADGTSSSYSSPGANVWVSAPGGEYGSDDASETGVSARKPAMVTTDFAGCGVGLKSLGDSNSFDKGAAPNTNCEHTATMNGTSSASPVLTGAIALILSANPNLTWRDVKHILAATADQVDAGVGDRGHPYSQYDLAGHVYEPGWRTNAAGYKFHSWYGFGRVNVDRAVAMARTYSSGWGPLLETNSGATWKYDSGALNASVPGGSAAGLSRSLTVAENRFVEAVQARVAVKGCVDSVGLELTSPAGTKSVLMNINSRLLDDEIHSHVFLSNHFYGENSAGAWTLKVIGGSSSCTPVLRSWQLNVYGH